VRDLLHRIDLGSAVTYPDIDLVVEGDAIRLARELAERYGGQVRSHQRFGTAKWLLPEGLLNGSSGSDPIATRQGRSNAAQGCPAPKTARQPAALDFVTARTEFYEHPSALPEVERSSIKQDLHRRDFTINTLAIRLLPEHFGEVLDFYGGESDLRQGLIRVLHSLSFVEDPTRILRAVRLEQRMGFRIESRTLELLEHALDLLDRVSGERIYHELHLILCEPEPERALRRLDELGVLRQINPELQADEWVMDRVTDLRRGLVGTPWERSKLADVHFLGILAFRLAPAALESLISRLRIPGYEADTLRQVELLHRTCLPRLQEPLRPSQIYALLSTFGSNALLIAWLGSSDEAVRAQLAQFQRDLRGVQPIIDGNYLRSTFQLRPGPMFRRVLDALRGARLDGLVVTLADEHSWVEGWMKERANGSPGGALASDEVPTPSCEEPSREDCAELPHASCPDVPPTGR
jgi:tRNA nucleotidyltransferase (CCA-adding enzyme)